MEGGNDLRGVVFYRYHQIIVKQYQLFVFSHLYQKPRSLSVSDGIRARLQFAIAT
jgi:hypothetical protein